MNSNWDYNFGIITGFIIGKEAPQEIQNALGKLKNDRHDIALSKPKLERLPLVPLPTESNRLLEKEANRVEMERTKSPRKPRKPLSDEVKLKLKKQLEHARAVRAAIKSGSAIVAPPVPKLPPAPKVERKSKN